MNNNLPFNKLLLICIFYLLPHTLLSQELYNIILVGDDGVTEDIKKAKNFVAIKKYPDNTYERLDYTLYGPLQKLRTYSDSTLKVLSGRSFEYDADGRLIYFGQYADNKKDGYWSYLNDTGKVFKQELYQLGKLLDADVKDDAKKDTASYPDEREASFKKSVKDWTKYIEKNLDPDAGAKSVKGGRILLRFVVNTKGETENIYLEKSVEFVLDEAAIKVIQDSPLWTPAFQNGKTVKAYRRQPLTFLK